jgi:CheY-like chemotaxis protein
VNQEVALAMLETLGCQIDIANNGREAIEATRHASYEMILMDCQMPEVNGFEATRTIREDEAQARPSGHTPIVALTANAMEGDQKQCLAAGMDDYLSKPYSQAQLENILRRWLHNKNNPSAEAEEKNKELTAAVRSAA